jgi:hypothetical protein
MAPADLIMLIAAIRYVSPVFIATLQKMACLGRRRPVGFSLLRTESDHRVTVSALQRNPASQTS